MKRKSGNKFLTFIILIISLILIGASGFIIYNLSLLNNIEDTLRMCAMVVIGVIALLFVFLIFRFKKKGKMGKLIVIIILSLLLSFVEGFAAYNIGTIYGSLKKVTASDDYKTYSSSMIVLADSKVEAIDDVKDGKIGILEDKTSYEGYIIPKSVIKNKSLTNDTENYSDFIAMIDALEKGDIDYAFVPTNYTIMYGSIEGYEDLADKTKIIYTKTKKVKKESTTKSGKSINEPITILLMGVDSEKEGIENSAFNGDSLMVLTFNPDTLNATILSIPRDSYVPIACFANQRKNKITHAAWKGEECMEQTIENLLDVEIDYNVKINFKGVVELVDTLGGVDIDVPYNLCEQNSDRQWGDKTVYIEKGKQTLNGEQALAYSRNRHPNPSMCSAKWTNYNSNDFVRGQHQQEVVKALLNKLKQIDSLDEVYSLLDTISNNMSTNMSTDEILSLYNVFKDLASKSSENASMADLLGMQRLYLNGYDQRIYDYGATNLSLYNYVLYDDSVKAVSDAMKENLGIKKVKKIKKFSFNINEPYEEEVIGKDVTSKKSVILVPSFVGQSLSYVNSFCSANGIKVNATGGSGTVISQNVPEGSNVEDVSSITVRLSGGGSTSSKTASSNSTNSNKTNSYSSSTSSSSSSSPSNGSSSNSDKGNDGNNNDGDSTDAGSSGGTEGDGGSTGTTTKPND